MYAVYQIIKSKKSVLDKMLADEVIGRQALTQKDGSSFGLENDKLVFLYEGSEEGNKRIKELFGSEVTELDKKKADEIYAKIKEEESQAEDGMGFLFG